MSYQLMEATVAVWQFWVLSCEQKLNDRHCLSNLVHGMNTMARHVQFAFREPTYYYYHFCSVLLEVPVWMGGLFEVGHREPRYSTSTRCSELSLSLDGPSD